MAQVTFSGSSGTIANLNQNFSQLYELRELISTPSYTAATPKLTLSGTGGFSIASPSAGSALTASASGGATPVFQSVGTAASSHIPFRASGSTTGATYISLNTSGGNYYFGANDAAGSILLGSTAYAFCVVTESARDIYLATNNVERLSINGTTGAISASANVTVTGNLLANASSSVIGYGSGSGGAVTQITSKSTGVTLDKATGTITMHNATLNATTSVSFVLTNSKIAATDIVNVSVKSGATSASYVVQVDAVAAGSCTITLRNYTAGNLSEAVVLSFAVIKGVAA